MSLRIDARVAVSALFAGLLSCAADPAVPEDFVSLEEAAYGDCLLSAVASSGNRYVVRQHENPEGATLGFWVDAVRRELVDARGYECTDEQFCASHGMAGRVLSFTVQNGLERYSYLVAVYVDDDRVLVCEAGGESEAFEADREAVLAAIEALPGSL